MQKPPSWLAPGDGSEITAIGFPAEIAGIDDDDPGVARSAREKSFDEIPRLRLPLMFSSQMPTKRAAASDALPYLVAIRLLS
jgi:hypothetical protein